MGLSILRSLLLGSFVNNIEILIKLFIVDGLIGLHVQAHIELNPIVDYMILDHLDKEEEEKEEEKEVVRRHTQTIIALLL